MKNTLHLNLKKQWFDMILSGEKKEEYRDITDYWRNRIIEHSESENIEGYFNFLHHGKSFDTVTFSNGYSKTRPQFEVELKDIRVGFGNLNWGAIPEVQYFVLELGEIISSFNCKTPNVLFFIDGS